MARVYCHDGKCSDSSAVSTVMTNMFDTTNIVDQIEHDLLKYSLR